MLFRSGDGHLAYWNYRDEAWSYMVTDGEVTSNSFVGTGWTVGAYNPGWLDKDLLFDIYPAVEITW